MRTTANYDAGTSVSASYCRPVTTLLSTLLPLLLLLLLLPPVLYYRKWSWVKIFNASWISLDDSLFASHLCITVAEIMIAKVAMEWMPLLLSRSIESGTRLSRIDRTTPLHWSCARNHRSLLPFYAFLTPSPLGVWTPSQLTGSGYYSWTCEDSNISCKAEHLTVVEANVASNSSRVHIRISYW